MFKRIGLTIAGIGVAGAALLGCYERPAYPADGPGCWPVPEGPSYIGGNRGSEGGGTWYSYGVPVGKSQYEDSCIEPL